MADGGKTYAIAVGRGMEPTDPDFLFSAGFSNLSLFVPSFSGGFYRDPVAQLMSEYFQAMLLGVIQGVAEFLPISSSGHLVVFGELMKRFFGGPARTDSESVMMSVALHLGTLGSILVVYRHDLRRVLQDYRLWIWIVVATIPTAVIGLTFKKKIEASFSNPLVVACGWLITAALLWFGQKLGRNQRDIQKMTLVDALVIGLFQSAALPRGISRSGSTIAGGLWRDFTREGAAKFSFLLAIPAIGGATVVEFGPILVKMLKGQSAAEAGLTGSVGPMIVGTVVSFVVGWITLTWLIRLIVRRGVTVFAIYCLTIAIATLIWQATERLSGGAGASAVSPSAAGRTEVQNPTDSGSVRRPSVRRTIRHAPQAMISTPGGLGRSASHQNAPRASQQALSWS